jgi:acyl-CoA thioester hydrolase
MPARTVSVPVRWGDLDAYGHVNNVAIMGLLEQARVQAFWDPREPVLPPLAAGAPVQVVVADAQVSYRRAIPYVQAVDVAVSVPKVGGASFVIAYEITLEGEVAVSASTTLALIDVATWRPLRLDAEQRQRLAGFLPSPVP